MHQRLQPLHKGPSEPQPDGGGVLLPAGIRSLNSRWYANPKSQSYHFILKRSRVFSYSRWYIFGKPPARSTLPGCAFHSTATSSSIREIKRFGDVCCLLLIHWRQ